MFGGATTGFPLLILTWILEVIVRARCQKCVWSIVLDFNNVGYVPCKNVRLKSWLEVLRRWWFGNDAVFLIAGLIHYVEYHGAPQSRQAECPEEGCINFWDAFYFVIVTVRQFWNSHLLMSNETSDMLPCEIEYSTKLSPVIGWVDLGRTTCADIFIFSVSFPPIICASDFVSKRY